MPEHSAGILLYRIGATTPEVLLVDPGGPFWTSKDAGALVDKAQRSCGLCDRAREPLRQLLSAGGASPLARNRPAFEEKQGD